MYLCSNGGMIDPRLGISGQSKQEVKPLVTLLSRVWNNPDIGLAQSETGFALCPSH